MKNKTNVKKPPKPKFVMWDGWLGSRGGGPTRWSLNDKKVAGTVTGQTRGWSMYS